MSDLNKKYDKILLELKENIKDPAEYQFVKDKISELTIMFMDSIDKMIEIQNHQEKIDSKIKKIQKDIKHIQSDFYVEDDEEDCDCCDDDCNYECEDEKNCEFEIICPYCDNEFLAGNNVKDADEIECPRCHKMIELDWNDDGCECDSCSSCYQDNKSQGCNACNQINNNQEKVAENDNDYNASTKNELDSNNNVQGENNKDDKNISNNSNKNEDDM